MPLSARLEPLSGAFEDRRRERRLQLSLGAAVGDRGSLARIHDISTRGLLFETSAELSDSLVEVKLPHSPPTDARIAWRHGRFFGCEFVETLTPGAVSAALLLGKPDARRAEAPLPATIAVAGEGEAISGPGWLKLAAVAALAFAGAASLVATGHLVALAVIIAVVAALAALAVWALWWAMDNAVNL